MLYNIIQVSEVAMLERKLSKNTAFPLSHQLIEILRDVILKGNYKAGQPFFTEKELAEKYGVSRTTIREATSRLVYEGLLRRERRFWSKPATRSGKSCHPFWLKVYHFSGKYQNDQEHSLQPFIIFLKKDTILPY